MAPPGIIEIPGGNLVVICPKCGGIASREEIWGLNHNDRNVVQAVVVICAECNAGYDLSEYYIGTDNRLVRRQSGQWVYILRATWILLLAAAVYTRSWGWVVVLLFVMLEALVGFADRGQYYEAARKQMRARQQP